MMRLIIIVAIFLSFLSCSSEDRVWLVYVETQCADAWDNLPGSTKDQVTEYLEKQGAKVIDVEIIQYSTGLFCAACTCPSGNNIRVLVDVSSKDLLVSLGFTE